MTKIKDEKEILVATLIREIMNVLESKYSSNDVEKYLFELIQTGLLYINLNISGLDDEWDKSVKLFFRKYFGHEQQGINMAEILDKLEQKRFKYAQTPSSSERENLIKEINYLFNTLFIILQEGIENSTTINAIPKKYIAFKYVNI